MVDKFGKHNSRIVATRLSLVDAERLERAAKKEKISRGEFQRDAILEEIRLSEEKIMAG